LEQVVSFASASDVDIKVLLQAEKTPIPEPIANTRKMDKGLKD
jgi:hypothetical protein